MDQPYLFGGDGKSQLATAGELQELAAWVRRMVVRKLRPNNHHDRRRAEAIANLLISPSLWGAAGN
jgi:hypothetical protein